ncbi:bifunctional hydroxymethylpyrimidine kinase/phosphomethylpyrimidine kinase [Halobacterium noricense]
MADPTAPNRAGDPPATPPVALTVAGTDSGGGAGVAADLKAMAARGAFGAAAVTAVTAQNTGGVDSAHPVPPGEVAAQIRAVVSDLPVAAAKTGMLGDAECVEAVAEALPESLPLVVDPVVVAASGARLLDESGVEALRERLLDRATVVTPNAPEAELLTGREVATPPDALAAARDLRSAGAEAALVTGGHLDPGPGDGVVDAFAGPEGTARFERDRVDTEATHGTGCTLSAAIAAELADSASPRAAVAAAESYLDRTLPRGLPYGDGRGPVNHLGATRTDAATPAAAARLREAVGRLERAGPAVADAVPGVGTNVAASPAGARQPDEVVAVEGRLRATGEGVRAAGGVARGASDHLARLLCGVREVDPGARAVANVRPTEAAVDRLAELGDVVRVDRREEPADAPGTMDWTAVTAMADRARAPVAIVDDGAHGKEPMARVFGDSAATVVDRVLVAAGVDGD